MNPCVGSETEPELASRYNFPVLLPQQKKAMRVATPHSKLVPVLMVDDARDVYSRDATATFRESKRLKGKKLYNDYAVEETIAISSEDEDDMELAKRLRSDPPSLTSFAGIVRVNESLDCGGGQREDAEGRIATRPPAEGCHGRTLSVERGRRAEISPLGARTTKGDGPTSIQRRLDIASHIRNVGARIGGGSL